MKYIRTKDEICEVYEDIMLPTIPPQYSIKGTNGKGVPSTDVIAEACLIEEICDEFVFVDEFGKKDLLDDGYKEKLQECGTFSAIHALLKQDRPKELYGAIWTEKGLIYVAKMNERLEMELI